MSTTSASGCPSPVLKSSVAARWNACAVSRCLRAIVAQAASWIRVGSATGWVHVAQQDAFARGSASGATAHKLAALGSHWLTESIA